MSASTSSLQLETSGHERPSLKSEVNERLAAHRTRRAKPENGQLRLPGSENTVSRQESLAARVAARVAERYSNAPTYSEMLAAEAAHAALAAEAALAAQAAVQAAKQASLAAQAIYAELETAAAHQSEEIQQAQRMQREQQDGMPAAALAPPQFFAAYHQPLPPPRDAQSVPERQPGLDRRTGHTSSGYGQLGVEVVDSFDEATVAAAQPLLAKLIEFPRELIAARKARPRLAEGPLREPGELDDAGHSQLRIFEAEPETNASETPAPPALPGVLPNTLPEWHSIRLSSRPDADGPERMSAGSARQIENTRSESRFDLPLKIASIEDRLMAAVVDVALSVSAFLLFVLVFAACTAHLPSGKTAIVGGALVFAGLFLAYQWLFFRYAEATPGMRYAKIALCTFDDENPTRKAMRRRIGAMLLAALPLGLGFAWAFFDDDRLGWHDRMTRTYQRSYR